MPRYIVTVGRRTFDIETPREPTEAEVIRVVRKDPVLMREVPDDVIRSWGTDAKRGVTPKVHYWRVRGNRNAKPFEKIWADEWKRRFGEPERVFTVMVHERVWTVPVRAVYGGAAGLGAVAVVLVLALRMRRRLASGVRSLGRWTRRLWGPMMPWIRSDGPVRVVAAAVLLLAMGRRSHDYYTVLRWVTCVVCAYAGARAMRQGQSGWVWTMWALAAFYNPIVEVELRKETWRWVNAATAATLAVSAWTARPRRSVGSGKDG
ncbi:MAG: hypothetical protein GX446_14360 [Chthonomonadales bacterium]|nr:hypothetical protein [Chthonomonadales bacterium]